MSQLSEKERKFLIVEPNPAEQEQLAQAIDSKILRTGFTFASNGGEAMHKINNDLPHVVITADTLPKMSGIDLVSWLLEEKGQKVAAIILTRFPDKEHFVDQVVTGQVQFLEGTYTDESFSRCLTRVLNFLSSDQDAQFKLRFVAPGEALVKEGDADKNVYLVRKGTLHASINRNNKEVVLGQVKEGEFVGEMAYINGEPRSADVIADVQCELIEIPSDHLDHVLFQKPSWAKALMQTLSRRVKRANEEKSS